MRMNQFVAPTSFITSISRRRANAAMRIVLTMSRQAAASRNTAMNARPVVSRPDSRCDLADRVGGGGDPEHARPSG